MGNPAGNGSLASELVAAELAGLLGLRVPDFAIVEIQDIIIEMQGSGPMERGPAFASRTLEGTPADGTKLFVQKLNRPGDVSKLIAFDTWIRNSDRCPPADALDPEPRRDNLFFAPTGRKYDIVALDHSHCFVEGDLDVELGDDQLASDPRVYGAFPEFEGFIRERDVIEATALLGRVTAAEAEQVVRAVPVAWGPSAQSREAWVRLITDRALFVSESLPELLLQQGRLQV
jgi:hypothetical protein